MLVPYMNVLNYYIFDGKLSTGFNCSLMKCDEVGLGKQ